MSFHRTVWNPADEGVVGRWGAATASIDWCEANYALSHHCAEVVNTATNIAFIALALFGLRKDIQHKLGGRFALTHAGMAGIGVGSALFHTTLSYNWQLCDELPMIYASTTLTWAVFETSPMNSKFKWALPLGLVVFNALFTWAYLVWPNPVFHQVAYGTLVAITTLRTIWLLRVKLKDSPANVARNSEARRLQAWGGASFLFAFFIWNLDNLLCVPSTRLKEKIGIPWAWALEGHGHWHTFTGLGVHTLICAMCYLTLCIRDNPEHYQVNYLCGLLPWVGRTPKGFAALANGGAPPVTSLKAARFSD